MTRRERVAVGLFALAVVALPFVHGELFPFTDAALFTDAQPTFAVHFVTGPDGAELPAGDFGLGLWYEGLRGDSRRHPGPSPRGVARPPTLNRWGDVPSEEAVRRVVAEALARGGPPYVGVRQQVIGALDADHVGLVAEHVWRVERPR